MAHTIVATLILSLLLMNMANFMFLKTNIIKDILTEEFLTDRVRKYTMERNLWVLLKEEKLLRENR